MKKISLSIILPVHNQADHIEKITQDLCKLIEAYINTYEVILVTNSCVDTSEVVCKQLQSSSNKIKHVDIKEPGWGRAIINGIAKSNNEFICYTNSARFEKSTFEKVLINFLNNPNMLCKGNRIKRLIFIRKWGSFFYNLIGNVLHSINTYDINGTPKFFPAQIIKLLPLEETGDLIDLELIINCRRLNIPIKDIDIFEIERAGGTSTTKILSALKMYLGSINLWLKNLI